MALRGLVWVDASANRVATVYASASLCNRRLTERRSLHRRLPATAQQCTQVPQNGTERPFSLICEHSCRPTAARATGRGPRVPRRRRPHGPRDARALGPEVHATGAVTQPPTHTNSRSLIIQGLAYRRGRRDRVPCGMIAAGKGRSSHQLERSSRGAGEASRTSRHPARGGARGARGSRGGRQCH